MRAGWGRRPRSSFPAEASGVACPSPWPWGSPLCRRCRQTHPPHLAHPGPRREPSALRPDRRSRSPFPPCPLPPPPPGPGSFPVRAMPPRGPRRPPRRPSSLFSLSRSLSPPPSPLSAPASLLPHTSQILTTRRGHRFCAVPQNHGSSHLSPPPFPHGHRALGLPDLQGLLGSLPGFPAASDAVAVHGAGAARLPGRYLSPCPLLPSPARPVPAGLRVLSSAPPLRRPCLRGGLCSHTFSSSPLRVLGSSPPAPTCPLRSGSIAQSLVADANHHGWPGAVSHAPPAPCTMFFHAVLRWPRVSGAVGFVYR